MNLPRTYIGFRFKIRKAIASSRTTSGYYLGGCCYGEFFMITIVVARDWLTSKILKAGEVSRIIEAIYGWTSYFPVRGMSCLTDIFVINEVLLKSIIWTEYQAAECRVHDGSGRLTRNLLRTRHYHYVGGPPVVVVKGSCQTKRQSFELPWSLPLSE